MSKRIRPVDTEKVARLKQAQSLEELKMIQQDDATFGKFLTDET